jgi:hypothetical protein
MHYCLKRGWLHEAGLFFMPMFSRKLSRVNTVLSTPSNVSKWACALAKAIAV